MVQMMDLSIVERNAQLWSEEVGKNSIVFGQTEAGETIITGTKVECVGWLKETL